ncbi:MAG TPA: EAL domain-containing response regulator [Nevskiaceae bacterium]|nr:EAL domain-containing response regulator [Nevskiaceae bacterium]
MLEHPYASLTALVVDDAKSIRQVLSAMLTDLGVGNVLEAEDGVSAFKVMEQSDKPIDLLFCDLMMPGVDGVETLRGLAARRSDAGVVLLSGMDPKLLMTVADMGEQLGLRVLGSMAKPFTQQQIKGALESYMRKHRSARAMPMMVTADELDDALRHGRIDVYYQPKVRLDTGKLSGVEALARMHHPVYGVIEPDSFIPLAEASTERITQLTMLVLDKAIAQAGIWRAQGLDLGMAINMSTLAIRRLDLPDFVADCARHAQVPHDKITLELTESQVAGGAEILHIVSRFRLRDFKLSIDDYGTGHSGLSRLRRLPFTELKIDRCFVNGAASDGDMRSILETSIDLGRRLRMDVVAEGVETWDDWHLLEGLGCDMAQGYVAARPIPAAGVPVWAQRWSQQVH